MGRQPPPAWAIEHVGGDHASLVVVVAGGEVGLEAGVDPQIGAAQPVHRQHQLEVLGVDLNQPRVRGEAEQEHEREQHEREGRGLRSESGRVGQQRQRDIEAESTVRKTVAGSSPRSRSTTVQRAGSSARWPGSRHVRPERSVVERTALRPRRDSL